MAENPYQSQPDPKQHSLFDAARILKATRNTAGMLMARDGLTALLAKGEAKNRSILAAVPRP